MEITERPGAAHLEKPTPSCNHPWANAGEELTRATRQTREISWSDHWERGLLSTSHMTKALVVFALLPLAACDSGDGKPTTLAELSTSQITMGTGNTSSLLATAKGPQVQLEFFGPPVTTATADDCVVLSADATATFDGIPMTYASRGGYQPAIDDPTCAGIQFTLDSATTQPGQLSTIVIRDASATWTIEARDLLTNDFALQSPVVPGAPATIAWASAPSIDNAFVQVLRSRGAYAVQSDGTIAGNAVSFDIPQSDFGTGTLSIDASRTAIATRCDGPASCSITVAGGADFPITFQ